MKRIFPRAKQKAIIKKFESNARMAKNVDALVSIVVYTVLTPL